MVIVPLITESFTVIMLRNTMDKYEPFKDYFGLSDLFNKTPALSGNDQEDSILQQTNISRCSEQVNGFLVDHNESPEVSVGQFAMHPVEAWLQRRSSTPIQSCNGQKNFDGHIEDGHLEDSCNGRNFNGHIEDGHLGDFLNMESVREPLGDDIDNSNNSRSTSVCDSSPSDFVPEGRPLRGTHSRRTSQSSYSSEVSMENANVFRYFEDISNGAAHCDDRLSPRFFMHFNDSPPFLDYNGSPPLMPRPRSSFEMCCALCKRNGETREYYSTHVLKDNRGKVICPILRKYVCPRCQATGDNAHTLRHCPVADGTRAVHQTFQTRHNSSGRMRFF